MPLEKGQRYEEEFDFSFEQVVEFARLTGDNNPIHLDKKYAEALGFKDTIVHGFLTGSVLSKILGTKFPGEGTIYLSQSMSFRAPVFPGETLVAEMEVIDAAPSGKYTIKTAIYSKESHDTKLAGEAVVLYRK